MMITTKKDLKKKYNLFVNRIILNFNEVKERLTKEDIEKIKKADKLISEILESIITKAQ